MGQRFRESMASLRSISALVLPHLIAERVRVIGGTVLAFGAAAFTVVSALLTASLLDILRTGAPPRPDRAPDLGRLLDLNTAGAESSLTLAAFLGRAGSAQEAILLVGLLLLVSTAAAVIANATSRWLWVSVRVRVIAELQALLFQHLLDLPMSFHVRHRVGTLLSRLSNDVGGVAAVLPVLFHTMLRAPFIVGATLLVLLRTSVTLTLITMFTAATYLAANFLFGRLVRQSFLRQSTSRADLMTIAQEALTAIRVVKAFGAERTEVDEMRRELGGLVREEIRGDLYSAQLPTGLSQLLSAAAAIVVSVAGIGLVASGELTEQGLVMFVLASAALLFTSAVMAESVVTIFMMSAPATRLLELWSIRPHLFDGPRTPVGIPERIDVDRVSFTYGEDFALSEVSLTIRKGEMLAIVGPSGAGKSTLADLILRLYDPARGAIRLDGVDVREFQQQAYRRLFGVVSQESLLFNDTVAKNIAYGCPWLTLEDVRVAATTANAAGFISELPQGYDTLVGDRGIRLSGGQRQRIAIARAVAGRPPVLIFDEATSALDSESERLVQDAIERVIASCTAIVIAHRLSTVRRADTIVVLDRGRVVETGDHDHLLRAGGVYQRLYEAGALDSAAATAVEAAP